LQRFKDLHSQGIYVHFHPLKLYMNRSCSGGVVIGHILIEFLAKCQGHFLKWQCQFPLEIWFSHHSTGCFQGERRKKKGKRKKCGKFYTICVSLLYPYSGHKIVFLTGQSIWCIIYNFTLEFHWNLSPHISHPLLNVHWFSPIVYKA
jgi:hypothetical protein